MNPGGGPHGGQRGHLLIQYFGVLFGVSSLGFLNPILRLKRWDVMSSCMQVENRG